MAKAKNIEDQMVAYAIQRNTVIATGEIVYFVFLQSKLWTCGLKISEFDFTNFLDKVCIKKKPGKESTVCIVENWDIINGMKGEA